MICIRSFVFLFFFFSSRRRHTRCALVTGVQTCALPILNYDGSPVSIDEYVARERIAGLLVISHGKVVLEKYGLGQKPEDKWISFRSEEHTSELQSLIRISYAVFCLKKKNV